MIRHKIALLTPLLVLSMSFVTAKAVHAQYGQPSNTTVSGSLQVTFGRTPHWMDVSGTRVQEIRQDERPDYDMFRYDNHYYAYNNNRWYSSNQQDGSFTYMDNQSVPVELQQVPREHWRTYPSDWQDRNRNSGRPSGTSASLQVTFGNRSNWSQVPGTRVMEIQGDRPDYDMFRYDNRYYAYNNNRWYSSDRQDGSFDYMDSQSVPVELQQVPREHWRTYPADWQDRNRGSRGSDGASATMQVTFGSRPRWSQVSGTRVMEIRQGRNRPDYDMFRYGNTYYVYNTGRWYASNQWNGNFAYIDFRSVPIELSRVPRDHWRNYPGEWVNQDRDQGYGNRRHHRRY